MYHQKEKGEKREKKNKKIIHTGARSETTTDNFISAAQANVSKGVTPNMYTIFNPLDGWSPVLTHHLLHTPLLPPLTDTPKRKGKGGKKKGRRRKRPPREDEGARGVARAAASLKRAHKCGRWAAGEDSFAPGRTLCNYGRTPARPGFFKAEGRGGRGRGSKNDNPERSAEFGALLKCCRFLLQPFSFASLPRHPLLQPPTPGLARASLFFFSELEKKKPARRTQPAGRRVARGAGWARGQRPARRPTW